MVGHCGYRLPCRAFAGNIGQKAKIKGDGQLNGGTVGAGDDFNRNLLLAQKHETATDWLKIELDFFGKRGGQYRG